MDKKTKEALRRYKKNKAREASSSDSSSSSESDTGTSSSYSSSDSDECKSNSFRRHRKKKTPRSEEERRSKREKREHCQKKLEAKRDHLKRKLKEAKLKKRAAAAAAVLSGHSHRSSLSPSTQAKLKKLAERKHLREVTKEGREREKHRSGRGDHERGELHHGRSPSKIAKLRLHQDVLKHQQQQTKSPQHMHQLMTREKIIIQTRAHDRTPSMERSLRHDRHDDRRDRERERAEREAARDKERAEALARCQERQRERERIAREKMRRDEEDDKKYGDSSGQGASSDRMLLSNDRDMMYTSGSNRGYSSRERSLEALERARYATKRELELDMYERDRNYLDVERHGMHDRSADGIRHDRDVLSSRRREASPLGERYTSRARDVREAYPEEDRERNYGRAFQSNESVTPNHHARERGNWLDSREMRSQDVSSDGRDYHERDMDLMYGGESEHLLRDRKLPVRGNEQWKSNWNASREPNEWSERVPIINSATNAPSPSLRKNDFNDGFKRSAGEMVGSTAVAAAREPMRASSETDWDVDNVHKKGNLRAAENTAAMKKTGDTWWEARRDHDKTTTNTIANANTSGIMATEPCEPPHGNPFWQNDWHGGMMPTDMENNQLRAPDMMHRIRNYRERPGPMVGYRAQHPPPLMNVSVQPPQPRGMYHGVNPRLPNKRNMTYTNPNLIKKQQQTALAAMKAATQASAVAAATTAVAAAKAAAQSAANSTTNPGILGQVVRQQQQQQHQIQYMENKPEAGEIVEITTNTSGIKKNNNNNDNNKEKPQLIELDKVSGELSEISDSDDEILNNIEKKPKLDNDLLPINETQSIGNVQTDVEQIKKINDETTTTTAINNNNNNNNNEMQRVVVDEEDMLDFEEISDGELEEDARHKNIGDALGVDWASLISENKEHSNENNTTNFSEDVIESAKQRWQSHRILLKLGVSCAMAGEEFAMKLLKESKEKSNENVDHGDNKIKIKKEKEEEDVDKKMHTNDLPKEDKELESMAELQPYAFAQVHQQRRLNVRKQMFANICGPFSRALSARKDLRIRRQLCDLPADDEFSNRPIPIVSTKIKNLALNAFQCALQVK